MQATVIITILFLAIFIIFSFWYAIDVIISQFKHMPPMVPSSHRLRNAVISEINKNFSQMRTVLDVGSCYGGMARRIANECPNKDVTAVEKMLHPVMISRMWNLFTHKHYKTIWGDAFEYIKKSDGFDIGISYLLPPVMGKLEAMRNKFKALIVLDFPLPNAKYTRKIELHHDLLGKHLMFVYEN